jgi:hypothetical protein
MAGAWQLGVARPGRRLVARGSMEDAWLKATPGEIESTALPRLVWWRGGGSGWWWWGRLGECDGAKLGTALLKMEKEEGAVVY